MRLGNAITAVSGFLAVTTALPTFQQPLITHATSNDTITPELFAELEELARIVDISYCVGLTGISKPFKCLSRCNDFPQFELVTTWNTGLLLSDSCGYIALDHSPAKPRIILAFRGTYSLANTIADLSGAPQDYVPYLGDDNSTSILHLLSSNSTTCTNCTVHSGFIRSWRNTRPAIESFVAATVDAHPSYELTLVGHSLGGAVALLAGLEFMARGWTPTVTTFGEPRVGNDAFVSHVDMRFAETAAALKSKDKIRDTYRRVTHVDDPVPLLPPSGMGYRPHASELYITKAALPPAVHDIRNCEGDQDATCSSGKDPSLPPPAVVLSALREDAEGHASIQARSLIPARYKVWQLFFAHRDYFWRLGLCIPGGDPLGWKGEYPRPGIDDEL